MIQTIRFKDNIYPEFQSKGNSAKYVREFQKEVCNGVGVDVGCNRLDWCFPGAFPIDPVLNEWDAYNFPEYFEYNGEKTTELDYIVSNHCLEHVPHWGKALNYWHSRLKSGGVCCLYLPDHSQVYWRVYHNFKHIHSFTPEIIKSYFTDNPDMWHQERLFVSGVDIYNSFLVIAEKK